MEKTALLNVMCPFCGAKRFVEAPVEGIRRYNAGALVQDAFPTLSDDDREGIMTGICNDCFPDDEDV